MVELYGKFKLESTNAVLPIPGRAATMIMSERCHPAVIRSNSVNPELIPLIPSLDFALVRFDQWLVS